MLDCGGFWVQKKPSMWTALAVWTRLELATSGVTGRHSNQLNYQTGLDFYICKVKIKIAVWTRLELATSGVTGRHSNQLNYQTNFNFVQF